MDVDPEAAGLDPRRLGRIDEHLRTRYLEPGKIAGCQVLVARGADVGYITSLGLADRERSRPVADDTIWRIYSMTKPVTGVALLTLYERGMFQLDDPVHRFIPAWRDVKVRVTGADGVERIVEAERPPTIRDLMMHMSGIGYSRGNGDIALLSDRGGYRDLKDLSEDLPTAPLRFQPGTAWLYSFGIDVCGYLVELLSGRPLDQYLQTEIFDPLGMVDTGFSVPEDDVDRFAAGYGRNRRKELVLIDDPATSPYLRTPKMLSGGGGLVSTGPDYLRFARMLLGGGTLDGQRVLGRKTVELMRTNHLPGGGELRDFALPNGYGEVGFDGMGFGLTVAVGQGPAATQTIGSAGDFLWGGAASTTFWVDPDEDLTVVFMTQLLPSGTFNFRGQLKSIIYPALSN